jgi:creatinine amidohydrolase
MPNSVLIDELSSEQIGALLKDGWETVIVVLGATEQHGPALPLCVDNVHGLECALRAARLLGKTLVGPAVTLGYSHEHNQFPGTVSISRVTLSGILYDIAESHARSGFRLVYFWLAHGGDNPVLQELLPRLEANWPGCYVTGLRDLAKYVSETWNRIPPQLGVPLSVSGSHAGEFETSMMLASRPELVRLDAAEVGNGASFESVEDTMMSAGIQAVSANGVLGDQRPANAERGQLYLNTLAEYLANDLKKVRAQMQEGGSE